MRAAVRRVQEYGGWPQGLPRKRINHELGCANKNKCPLLIHAKENETMNGTVIQAVLWIVAGFFLTLLIIRRSKRKTAAPKS